MHRWGTARPRPRLPPPGPLSGDAPDPGPALACWANQPPTTEVDRRIVPYTDRRAWRQLGARSDGDAMNYKESWVKGNGHRIDAREYPGQEPAIVLMHGFPDNLHLYDRLLPHLTPPRRVITFDFLGWLRQAHRLPLHRRQPDPRPGRGDRPAGPAAGDCGGPRRLRSARHRLGVEAPRPGRRPGAAQHLLLPHARAAVAGGDLAVSTPLVRQVTRPASRLFGDLVFLRMYLPTPPTRGNTS
jgi:hypothetical protein